MYKQKPNMPWWYWLLHYRPLFAYGANMWNQYIWIQTSSTNLTIGAKCTIDSRSLLECPFKKNISALWNSQSLLIGWSDVFIFVLTRTLWMRLHLSGIVTMILPMTHELWGAVLSMMRSTCHLRHNITIIKYLLKVSCERLTCFLPRS